MSSLILSKQYEADPVIAQKAYEWFFPEPVQQQVEHNPDFYEYNVVITSYAEPQLEMFQRNAVVEDYVVFKLLADQWRSERGSTSSITDMVLCPSYQGIIGMGQKAIRYILTELLSEGDDPDHWFWALQAVTGVNPVSEEDEGNLRRMSKAWLDWAASEGYAW